MMFPYDYVVKKAKDILKRDKHHHPMAFLERGRNQPPHVMLLTGMNSEQKREVLKKLVSDLKSPSYYFIDEAWYSSNIPGALKGMSPSQDPNRLEALMVHLFHRNLANNRSTFILFHKDKDGEIVFDKEFEMSQKDMATPMNVYLETEGVQERIDKALRDYPVKPFRSGRRKGHGKK